MSKKDWIEVGVSLFSGAGIGAGLMYLFDPQVGDRRREAIAAAAEEAMSGAGNTLGNTWQSLADRTRDAAQGIADRAGSMASGARSTADDYADSASRQARSWARSASRGARGYAKSARSMFGFEEDHPYARATGITAGAIGALALGAGLMFLFDPGQGRRRRALLRDKTSSAAHEASDYAQKTGRYLSNKTRGMAAEAKSKLSSEPVSDETLAERVRSAVGRVPNVTGLMCRAENGRIILNGPVGAKSVDAVLSAVRGVTGVQSVDNQLDVRAAVGSM